MSSSVLALLECFLNVCLVIVLNRFKGMSVDDFLKGGFMEGDSDV